MKRFQLYVIALFWQAAFQLWVSTAPVLAQQGYQLLVALSVDQASPGATVELIGSHFEPETHVMLVLHQNGNELELGSATADYDGDFEASVLLPYDLALGKYEFRALDAKGSFATAPLYIVADPNAQEGAGQREEEDPLLAPMPTFAPGVIPGVVTSAAPAVSPAPVPAPPTSDRRGINVLGLIALLVFGAAFLLLLGRKRTA